MCLQGCGWQRDIAMIRTLLLFLLLLTAPTFVLAQNGLETCDGTIEEYDQWDYELWSQEKYEKSIIFYTCAITRQPQNPDLYLQRAFSYFELAEYEQAISDYTQAIELDPDSSKEYPYPFLMRGRALSLEGKYDQALSDQTLYIELRPMDPVGYYWRGMTHFYLSDFAMSLSDLSHAIDLNPAKISLYTERASVFFNAGDYEKAIDDYTTYLEFVGEDAEAYYWRCSSTLCDRKS